MGTLAHPSDQEIFTVLQILAITWGQITKGIDVPMVGKDYILGKKFH